MNEMKIYECLIRDKYKLHTYPVNHTFRKSNEETYRNSIKNRVKQQKIPRNLKNKDKKYLPDTPYNHSHKCYSFKGSKGYDPHNKCELRIFDEGGYLFLCGFINGFVVLDLDIQKPIWNELGNNHSFIKYYQNKFKLPPNEDWKKTLRDIIDNIDTFTVSTPSGGFHLYFSIEHLDYETHKDILNGGQISILEMDLQGENKLIIGCGTTINHYGDYKTYMDYRNTELQELNIEDWKYFKSFMPEPEKQIQKTIKSIRDNNTKKNQYSYTGKYISNELLQIIEYEIMKCPELFNGDTKGFPNFRRLTGFYKAIDRQTEWDNISKKFDNYNYEGNMRIWEQVWSGVDFVLDKIGLRYMKGYIKYKKIPENVIKFNKKLYNASQISKFLNLETNVNYFIKSGTGTGKTYLVCEYVLDKHPEYPILCITSRVSMADELHRQFLKRHKDFKSDIDINTFKYYKTEEVQFFDGDNIFITIDSIGRLFGNNTEFTGKFSDYTIVLDEVNSLIQYVFTSSTLKNNRRECINKLVQILSTCRQVIGLDADITDYCLEFMNINIINNNPKLTKYSPNLEFEYVNNTNKHFEGKPYYIYNDYTVFVEEISKCDKFLVCSDSKKEADKLSVHLTSLGINGITVICKLWEGSMDLDLLNKCIFTPKIIYGVDSLMERNVFVIYTGNTLHFTAYLQQLARCRNPIALHILHLPNENFTLFNSEKNVIEKLLLEQNDLDSHYSEFRTNIIKNCEEYVKKQDLDTIEEQETLLTLQVDNDLRMYRTLENENNFSGDFYNYILSKIIYNWDCGNSNKFLHLLLGLDERGWVRQNDIKKFVPRDRIQQDQLSQEAIELNYEDLRLNPFKQVYLEKAKILHIEEYMYPDYAKYLVENNYIKIHLAYQYLFKETYDNNEIKLFGDYCKDFSYNCNLDFTYPVKLVKEILISIEATNNELYGKRDLSEEQQKKYSTRMKDFYRDKSEIPYDLSDSMEIAKTLKKFIISVVFDGLLKEDKNIFTIKRKTRKQIPYIVLNKSSNFYLENEELYNRRFCGEGM